MFYFLHRNDQNTEAMSKAHAIEDLHSRLKSNVESIQQLNQQVSSHAVLNHNGYSPCKNLYSSDSLIRSTQTLPRRKKYSNTFSTSVWKVGEGGRGEPQIWGQNSFQLIRYPLNEDFIELNMSQSSKFFSNQQVVDWTFFSLAFLLWILLINFSWTLSRYLCSLTH